MRWIIVPVWMLGGCDESMPVEGQPPVDVTVPPPDANPPTTPTTPPDTTTPALAGPPYAVENWDEATEICISGLDAGDRVVDEALVPELDYPTDLNVLVTVGCYIGADALCRTSLIGDRIDVDVRSWIQTEPEIFCLVDVPYVATCPLPPLPAGTYSLTVQGHTTTFDVPYSGRAICSGTNSAAGNPGW